MIRRLFCTIGAIVFGITLTVSVLLIADRRPVVVLDASQSMIRPSPAIPGKPIFIVWNARAMRNCAGTVIPRVIDSSGRIYEYARSPVVYQDIMQPGDRSFTKTLTLPEVMAPGPARYQAIIIRWCNPLQKYLWPMVDEPFPIHFTIK